MVDYHKTFELNNLKNKKVVLGLWISRIRKLGSILFVIGIDSGGSIQIVNKNKKTIEKFNKEVNKGDLLEIKGIVKDKEKKNDNEEKKEIEVELLSFKILNKSSKLPFEIEGDDFINEDLRYKYRYLDLRREKSKGKIIIKCKIISEIRKFFDKDGFFEIDTPILSQKSPEGAKCFLVISNLKDKYYTLPQSPQIFKQTLMISGIDKYYQIAKCFRNEDIRSNRQIEFLQLDVEMSFTESKKLIKIIEKMFKKIIERVFDNKYLISFQTIDYKKAIEKYGNDKPDLRNEDEKNNRNLKFLWIINYPLFIWNNEEKKYELKRHPFTNIKKKYLKKIIEKKIRNEDIISDSFDLVCNGEEIISGGMRINNRKLQESILDMIGYNKNEQEENFGYFLKSLEFAPPIHGGFGMGIERFISKLLETKNMKEIIAFPKNIDGTCSLTKTPNFYKKMIKNDR